MEVWHPRCVCVCEIWKGYVVKNSYVNPLNSELNPICHVLALLQPHHILHVSRIRVKIAGVI